MRRIASVGRLLSPRPSTSLVLGLLTTFALSHLSSPSLACSPPLVGWATEVPEEGPANGAIVVQLWCYSDCESWPELTVKDMAGNPVPGTVMDSGLTDDHGWLAWQPESPFSAGENYRLHLVTPKGPLPAVSDESTYTVLENGPDVAPSEPVHVEVAAHVELLGEQVCCDRPPDSCGNTCFRWPEEANSYAYISVTWFDSAKLNDQFLLSGEFRTATERVVIEPNVSRFFYAKLPPAAPGDEYCYTLTARHLVTGKETELAGCISADDVELPDVEAQMASERANELRHCTAPPKGLEAEWCEQMESRDCKASPEACERADTECGTGGIDCSLAAGTRAETRWWLVAVGALGAAVLRRLSRQRRA